MEELVDYIPYGCGVPPTIRWLNHATMCSVSGAFCMLLVYNRKIPWFLLMAFGVLAAIDLAGQWEGLPFSALFLACAGNAWWYVATYLGAVLMLCCVGVSHYREEMRKDPVRVMFRSQLTIKLVAILSGILITIFKMLMHAE